MHRAAANATKMVSMAMRVDNGDNRPCTELLIYELQRDRAGFAIGQWIDQNPARFSRDHGHI